MTYEQAERLGRYVLDAGLDANILAIERGDCYVVRLTAPQWHLWSFADWSEFARTAKQQRKHARKAKKSAEE